MGGVEWGGCPGAGLRPQERGKEGGGGGYLLCSFSIHLYCSLYRWLAVTPYPVITHPLVLYCPPPPPDLLSTPRPCLLPFCGDSLTVCPPHLLLFPPDCVVCLPVCVCLSVCLFLLVCLCMYVCLSLSVCLCLSFCLCLSVCLFLPVCLCQSVCLSVSVFLSVSVCLCLSLPACLSLYVCLTVSVSLSECLSVSVCLSVRLCLSVCLSLYVGLSLSVCLSVQPSVYPPHRCPWTIHDRQTRGRDRGCPHPAAQLPA